MSITATKKLPKNQAQPHSLETLLQWYRAHGRDLPWRSKGHGASDPYYVWISEIMLQQTTVATVIDYYQRFLETFPTIHDLAAADLDAVLAQWAGLGYYRRARMLHACAQTIVTDYGGRFPTTETELLSLAGIGPYTAHALMTIAFNQPAPILDGNVERVLSRLLADATPLPQAKKHFRKALGQMWPNAQPATDMHGRIHSDLAQALMDLGATVCTPTAPDCMRCPLAPQCQTFANGNPEAYPVKAAKKPKPTRTAMAHIAITDEEDPHILLHRHAQDGVLHGLWMPPTMAWHNINKSQLAPKHDVKHVFTHFTGLITLEHHTGSRKPLEIQLGKVLDSPLDDPVWLPISQLRKGHHSQYGIPKLGQKMIVAALERLV